MFEEVLPPRGKFFGKVFAFPVRVYYEDTDAGGIVYYANYLRFAERARTEYVRALGCNQQEALESEDRFAFAVRHLDIDYKAPAVLDDVLTVTCEIKEFSGAAATMFQQIWRGDKLLTELNVKVAHLSLARKRPVRIPESLIEAVEKL